MAALIATSPARNSTSTGTVVPAPTPDPAASTIAATSGTLR
ncbi:hypothetical protein [Kitasatospora fiedleri]|nr:hypothetical protein [Kitasatospora fiedleri]